MSPVGDGSGCKSSVGCGWPVRLGKRLMRWNNYRLRDVGGLVRPGMSPREACRCESTASSHPPADVILETAHHSNNAANSAQRTAAEEPRAFACPRIQMQQCRSKPVKRHRPFLRSQFIYSSKSSKRLLGPLDLLYNVLICG